MIAGWSKKAEKWSDKYTLETKRKSPWPMATRLGGGPSSWPSGRRTRLGPAVARGMNFDGLPDSILTERWNAKVRGILARSWRSIEGIIYRRMRPAKPLFLADVRNDAMLKLLARQIPFIEIDRSDHL